MLEKTNLLFFYFFKTPQDNFPGAFLFILGCQFLPTDKVRSIFANLIAEGWALNFCIIL